MVSVQNLGGSMIKKNNVWTERIIWISKSEGGRQTLPTSEKYGPIIKITGSDNNDPNWSLIVNITNVISEIETIAEIYYLSDRAPNNLHKGVRFSLLEGKKLVATGVIL